MGFNVNVMSQILNVSAYQFIPLDDLEAMKEHLYGVMEEQGVMGTLLLSPEGINVSIAGEASGVKHVIGVLEERYGILKLPLKFAWSDNQPFKKRFVKIKPVIIPSGNESVDVLNTPSKKISPQELHRWLAENRDFILLDTRNDFEVCFGTFKDAVTLSLDKFRHFQSQVGEELNNLPKDKPVVMFCTGGIRCEKGAPLMESLGFTNIYQLDGGILNYYAACGNDFYEGDCYVFDERIALNADLKPTGVGQCIDCQRPIYKEGSTAPLDGTHIKVCDCYD